MMNRNLTAALLVACSASVASAALVPVTTIKASNSNFDFLGTAFNAQPAVKPVVGDFPAVAGNGEYSTYADDRSGIIDFGANYADVAITEVFHLVGSGPAGVQTGAIPYFWSNSTDVAYEPGNGDALAPNFGFLDFPGGFGANARWIQPYSNPAGLTPQGRYLIWNSGTGTQGNFKYELVFWSDVPEPTSLALLGLGGLAMGRRRR